MTAIQRIAELIEANPPSGFSGRYSAETWQTIVSAVLKAEARFYEERQREWVKADG